MATRADRDLLLPRLLTVVPVSSAGLIATLFVLLIGILQGFAQVPANQLYVSGVLVSAGLAARCYYIEKLSSSVALDDVSAVAPTLRRAALGMLAVHVVSNLSFFASGTVALIVPIVTWFFWLALWGLTWVQLFRVASKLAAVEKLWWVRAEFGVEQWALSARFADGSYRIFAPDEEIIDVDRFEDPEGWFRKQSYVSGDEALSRGLVWSAPSRPKGRGVFR